MKFQNYDKTKTSRNKDHMQRNRNQVGFVFAKANITSWTEKNFNLQFYTKLLIKCEGLASLK